MCVFKERLLCDSSFARPAYLMLYYEREEVGSDRLCDIDMADLRQIHHPLLLRLKTGLHVDNDPQHGIIQAIWS